MGVDLKALGKLKPFRVLGGPIRQNTRKFMWWFPKIRDAFLGVPIKRIIIFWGLYWGLLIWGNYLVPK